MSGGDSAALVARALEPGRSVVVAACAGSGKTWLLVSRILRLLLAGAAPGEILAITFTRAAAQEMAARLREWLQFLAGADDQAARRFLQERSISDETMDDALARARTLHEAVLTAYPGITITTFHSWYLQLLRNAPLSAGTLGNLSLSEHTAALIDEAWELFAESCRRAPQDAVARGLDVLLRDYGLLNTQRMLSSFLRHRADWWAYAGAGEDAIEAAIGRMTAALAVDPDADLVAEAFASGSLKRDASAFGMLLERNNATDQTRGAMLAAALASDNVRIMYEALCAVLFTTRGEPRVRKSSSAQQKRLGVEGEAALLNHHATLCARVAELKSRLADQRSLRMHACVLPAAVGLLDAYQQLKRDRQILDFADVEWHAFDLLAQHEQAITLQFKLDSRYRHILLDEFQDTNPLQWLALKSWFDASAAAQSASVVFLVGDPKQAIYRFRRAEARLFDAAREWLIAEHDAVVLEQDESRRCARPVLDIVNQVFARDPAFADDFRPHSTHDANVPGRVEVLPLAVRSDTEEGSVLHADGLRDPLSFPLLEEEDQRRETEAGRLVERVREIVSTWEVAADAGADRRRPARYADIMVLVRRRTHLAVYERALRHAGIPFTTSRRGGLLDTLEVQDLIALLGFLISPFDDLKLAHALRSPIFDCTDEDLMRLATTPGPTWWARLLDLADLEAGSRLGRARELLSIWLARADHLPVHDHLDKIYFEGDVARRYAAAVPPAIREAVVANLHAFIERALAIDSGRYPSLPRFLDELKDLGGSPAEEAPDEGGIDDGGNAVRILTVHGAKGLEAPIVWLLDAASLAAPDRGYDVLVEWPTAASRPTAFSFRTRQREWNRLQQAQMQDEARNEHREDSNLLYVAMTRARQALIVSGCEATGQATSWYERIRTAVAAQTGDEGAEASTALTCGDDLMRRGEDVSPTSIEPASGDPPSIPRPASIPVGRRRELAMSPGQRYGTAFHRIMECLALNPDDDAPAIAAGYGLSAEDARQCAAQARALLHDVAMRRFFDPSMFLRAFNELPLVDLAGELRRIDRLVEFEDEVWVLDYKTGRFAGEDDDLLVATYRSQVAAYCESVRVVYPDKRVHGALVFADGTVIDVER